LIIGFALGLIFAKFTFDLNTTYVSFIPGIRTEIPEIETTEGQTTISDTATSPETTSPTAASQTATSPSTTPDHIDDIGSDSKEPDGMVYRISHVYIHVLNDFNFFQMFQVTFPIVFPNFV